MTTTRHRIVAAGLTTLLTVLGPVAALAQTGEAPTTDRALVTDQERPEADVDTIKERAEAAIQRRLLTIDRLQYHVRSNPHVTDDHQATLLSELDAASTGLAELSREIAAAETAEELRVLVPQIAEDYRIYVLVVPKVKEVLASDAVEYVVDRFEIAEEELSEAIARAEEAGYDVSAAKEFLAEMVRSADEAEALGGPIAETVLGLQPSDWPDPAQGVLREGHRDLVDARHALRKAHQAAGDALRALREAIGAADDTA